MTVEVDEGTLIFTPEYVINQLFSLGYFDLKRTRTVLDPGSGQGVFSRVVKELNPATFVASVDAFFPFNEYSDVHVKGDFTAESALKISDNRKFDLIIGNPPFHDALSFIDESMKCLADKGDLIFLLRANQLNPKKYRAIRENYWLKEVLTLEKRIAFNYFARDMKKGAVDSRDYSWFHFKHRAARKDYAVSHGGSDRFITMLTYIPNETRKKNQETTGTESIAS